MSKGVVTGAAGGAGGGAGALGCCMSKGVVTGAAGGAGGGAGGGWGSSCNTLTLVARMAMAFSIIILTLATAFGHSLPIGMPAHPELTAVSASWKHVPLTAMQKL